MKKTISFSATLGVNQGYGHANAEKSALQIVSEEWQKAAAEVMASGGVYIGAVVKDSRTVYHTDWGCPVGGEVTAEISGTCNPEYTAVEAYKSAVIAVLEKCAKTLGQSTTQVVFTDGDFAYLDFRPKEA